MVIVWTVGRSVVELASDALMGGSVNNANLGLRVKAMLLGRGAAAGLFMCSSVIRIVTSLITIAEKV